MMDKKHAIIAMVLEGKKVYRIDWDRGTWVEYDEKKRCFIDENGFDVDLNAYYIDETWDVHDGPKK